MCPAPVLGLTGMCSFPADSFHFGCLTATRASDHNRRSFKPQMFLIIVGTEGFSWFLWIAEGLFVENGSDQKKSSLS